MTDRPEGIQRRLHGLDEIGEVVGALRAIASGHASSAQGALQAISTYSSTVTKALTIALTAAEAPLYPEGPGLLLVVGASQGFCGAYPARIGEAALAEFKPGMGLLVAGSRTADTLRAASLPVLWSTDLPGHPKAIPELASQATDALLEQSTRHPGPIRALTGSGRIGNAPILSTLFPPASASDASSQRLPITTLPPAELIAGLLQESLFAGVAHIMMQGAEAEARARMEAMARAQNNLRTRRAEVWQAYQQARQEQMTTEMIELAAARPRD